MLFSIDEGKYVSESATIRNGMADPSQVGWVGYVMMFSKKFKLDWSNISVL